jgi:flagellar basal body-associated protein FliL
MDEKEKKPAQDAAPEQAKAAKKLNTGKIIFYAIIAGALVLNTIIAFVLFSVTRPKDVAEKEAQARADSLKTHVEGATREGEPITDPVEAVVNIAGTSGERFLKVSLLLCYDPVKYPKMVEGGEGKSGLGAKKPLLKDILIEIVSQMTLVELGEPESRTRIRDEFLRKANALLPSGTGEYSNVLIDQMIIQ